MQVKLLISLSLLAQQSDKIFIGAQVQDAETQEGQGRGMSSAETFFAERSQAELRELADKETLVSDVRNL